VCRAFAAPEETANTMRFWRSPFGAIALLVLLGAGTGLGATAIRVVRQTTPPRVAETPIDFESMMIHADDVEFQAADGVRLSGWWIAGEPGRPPIVLCHDLGASKSSLVNIALALSRVGFPVLLFDFRAHGDSQGDRSTLGLREKRDVVGAVDFLARREEDPEPRRLGIFGVGMGAYAAVLAAADRPAMRVLVLDGLYPDTTWALARGVFRNWGFGVDHLAFFPRGVFVALTGFPGENERAADVIANLYGRDMLLLAPASDTRLSDEMTRMVQSVPEQADADGNLVILPATHADGLYAFEMTRYHERVAEFFTARLND